MSEAAESAPAKKKLHNPLHVTIMVVLVTGLCAFLLHKGTEQKYVFGILLAVTLGMLALEKINKAILVLLGAGIALLLATWQNIIIGGEMHDGHSVKHRAEDVGGRPGVRADRSKTYP